MKNKWYKINSVAVWSIVIIFTSVLVFYIMHNGHWLIGDDSIIISRTGNGLPFKLSSTINPAGGRFFPFAYLPYNILLLFNSGYITANSHYLVNSAFFVIMIVALAFLITKIVFETGKTVINNWIILFLIVIISQRTYTTFLNVFSTMWVDYTLLVLFLLSTYFFYTKKYSIYGIISLIFVNYLMYCLETMFVLPFVFGFCSLVFGYKSLEKPQRIFNFILLGSSLLFLSLYYILVYRYTTQVYDASHGSSESLIHNSIRMFVAQKVLWIAVVILCVRLFNLLYKKDTYNVFFDSLLFASVAYTLGGFILRLNWTLYYTIPVITVAPAIVYYLLVYIKSRWTFIVLSALVVVCMVKYPNTIKENQKIRKETFAKLQQLVNYKKNGYKVIWYDSPVAPLCKGSFDVVLRNWKENSLKVYLSYALKDKNFQFDKYEKIPSQSIILYPQENNVLDKEGKDSNENLKNLREIADVSGIKILKN